MGNQFDRFSASWILKTKINCKVSFINDQVLAIRQGRMNVRILSSHNMGRICFWPLRLLSFVSEFARLGKLARNMIWAVLSPFLIN